jgi:hypothetical protein
MKGQHSSLIPRPSSLFCSGCQRRREIDPALVEGAAYDTAGQPETGQPANVLHSRNPTRGDDGQRYGSAQFSQAVEIGSLHHAVLADVSADNGGERPGLTPLREIKGRHVRDFQPTIRDHSAVLRIEPQDDLTGKATAKDLEPSRVFQGARANNDPSHAPRQGLGDVLRGAQTTAELTGTSRRRGDDPANTVAIDRPTFFRSVEINEMQPGSAALDPATGHGSGVVAEDRFLRIVALPQTNAATASQVDGREDEHGVPPDERKPRQSSSLYRTKRIL